MKPSKGKKSKKAGLSDTRFAHLQSDPKFSTISSISKKVVLEDRFAAALTDEKFSTRAKVDKRGRLVRANANELSNLYEVAKKDEEEEDVESDEGNDESGLPAKRPRSADDSDDEEEKEEEEGVAKKPKLDLARGRGNVSSSDSDSDDYEWETEEQQDDVDFSQLDNEAESIEWASRRLAACNLDWDLIKAEDLLVLVQSFKPPGGSVERVTIYLSDFGKERLEIEDVSGPRLQLDKPIDDNALNRPDQQTQLALRQYHLDRLKYYYAVIEFDSVATASTVYEQCDGFLFEATGIKMDLRFVPDDMEFDEDRLKERVNGDEVNVENYRASQSDVSAVANTNAQLAWDTDDRDRSRKLKEAFNDDAMMKNHDLLASSDSEDEETVKKRRDTLLSLLNDTDAGHDLQVDWGGKSGGDESDDDNENEEGDDDDVGSDIEKALARRGRKAAAGDESEDDDEDVGSDIEKALARRAKDESGSDDEGEEQEEPIVPASKPKKNGYTSYLERKKLKKKERKQKFREEQAAEKEAIRLAAEGAKQKLKETKKLKKKTQSVTEKAEEAAASAVVADDRFKALFTDSQFTIEQSSNQYKGSKVMEKQAEVKRAMKEEQPKKEDDLLTKLKSKSGAWNKKKSAKKAT